MIRVARRGSKGNPCAGRRGTRRTQGSVSGGSRAPRAPTSRDHWLRFAISRQRRRNLSPAPHGATPPRGAAGAATDAAAGRGRPAARPGGERLRPVGFVSQRRTATAGGTLRPRGPTPLRWRGAAPSREGGAHCRDRAPRAPHWPRPLASFRNAVPPGPTSRGHWLRSAISRQWRCNLSPAPHGATPPRARSRELAAAGASRPQWVPFEIAHRAGASTRCAGGRDARPTHGSAPGARHLPRARSRERPPKA